MAIHWLFPERRVTVLPRGRQARVVLGRSEGCDVVLPGQELSRRHAELRRDGPLLLLRDLDSRNGVFLRGTRVDHAPIQEHDVLRIGEWIGLVGRASHASAPLSVQGARSTHGDFGEVAPGLYGGRLLRESVAPLDRAARSDLPVVIEGETGTGKEGTARAVHAWSGREGPFLAVNCAALPESLAEAELFGYRKGAFTGAERTNPGYFRAAHGGTLLLDEVVDLPLTLQAKLLRVLEQREVHPLGESAPFPVDVRIVAAAQQPLADAVRQRRFRGDLCARLDGLTVRLPPLRERMGDVPDLLHLKLREHASVVPQLEPELVERLCIYDWPFNVRELDLLARQLLVLHGHEKELLASYLPERFRAAPAARDPHPPEVARAAPAEQDASADANANASTDEWADGRDRRDLNRLLAALRRHAGNVTRAAAEASISRQRAYRLMESRGDVDRRDANARRAGPESQT